MPFKIRELKMDGKNNISDGGALEKGEAHSWTHSRLNGGWESSCSEQSSKKHFVTFLKGCFVMHILNLDPNGLCIAILMVEAMSWLEMQSQAQLG